MRDASKEDESKRAWLSNIDVPALTEATAAVAEVADPTREHGAQGFHDVSGIFTSR